MTDSVAVLDIEDVTDRAAVESTIQTWLTANSAVTSVDAIDYEKVKRNRGQVIIAYTA